MPCIVLLCEVPASHSPLAAQLTPEWLAACAAALETQLTRDVAPVWPWAEGARVRVGSGPDDLGPQEIPARILATLPDAPGAIAYHDDDSGAPDVFLGLDDCETLADVSSALSHEFCEMSADPNCDQWVTVPSGTALPDGITAGQQIAMEVCDPLQDRVTMIGDVTLSDWCLPAYFGLGATPDGPTSFTGQALAPFGRTFGGYQLARNADGSGEAQVAGSMTAARQKRAKMVGSRPERRMRRGR